MPPAATPAIAPASCPQWPHPRRFLTVQRPNGRRVVVVTDEQQLKRVRSGQRVRVGGRWLSHPGRGHTQTDDFGPDDPVALGGAGCGRSKRCIRAASILPDYDQPQWQPPGDTTAGEPSPGMRQGTSITSQP